ncbi:hypothetical protein [Kitasatospora sp. NPDC088779]|uniref:hypothetical protein n=1 Tax=Kitasatospora sp. NPDC088779 TaxID=3154964 RepID=UPI003430E623
MSASQDTTRTLQELCLQILATAQAPMRSGDVLTVILHLQTLGRTTKLLKVKHQKETVRTALKRLAEKGQLVKTEPGLYATARDDAPFGAAQKAEAA